MGMFSWCCKGCGHELCTGEWVRIGMHKEEYDGYGGSAGGEYEPVAWHQACYETATTEQKLDETPSKSAPNQGFGPAKLAFKKGYDLRAETTYTAVVYGSHYDRETEKSTQYQFLLTDKGLEDELAYDAGREAFAEQYFKDNPEPKDWYEQPYEQREAHYEKTHAIIVAQYGSSPESRQIVFSTIEECVQAASGAVGRFLPDGLEGEYTLTIFGTQGKLVGAVYEATARRPWEKPPREYHKLGIPFEEWKRCPEVVTKVSYKIGCPADQHDKTWE